MDRRYGPKYDKSLTLKDIAKRVREDIKAAIKSGELPKGLGATVKTRYYSGGSSLDVTIRKTPYKIFGGAPAWGVPASGRAYSDEARTTVERIKAIVDAYNYDGSDAMTDYFDVRFYGHVSHDWELESAEREAPKAPEPAPAVEAPAPAAPEAPEEAPAPEAAPSPEYLAGKAAAEAEEKAKRETPEYLAGKAAGEAETAAAKYEREWNEKIEKKLAAGESIRFLLLEVD